MVPPPLLYHALKKSWQTLGAQKCQIYTHCAVPINNRFGYVLPIDSAASLVTFAAYVRRGLSGSG